MDNSNLPASYYERRTRRTPPLVRTANASPSKVRVCETTSPRLDSAEQRAEDSANVWRLPLCRLRFLLQRARELARIGLRRLLSAELASSEHAEHHRREHHQELL